MIRVTVELISAIDPSRNVVLGVATIANDGQGSLLSDGRRGDYDVVLSKWAPKLSQVWRKGRVTGFDRKNRGGWDLLFLALRACVADRNP